MTDKKKNTQETYFLVGGGTGGHALPALALAEVLKRIRPQAEIFFIGTRRGIEADIIPRNGFPLLFITVRGIARRRALKNLFVPVLLGWSLLQSMFLLFKYRPDAVIGTGGYVSGPMLYMATVFRIPTVIQEQNSYPGVTTRLLAKRVDLVHLAFPDARSFLKRQDNVRISGNPVRKFNMQVSRNSARSFWKLKNKPTLLVMGGSQGSVFLNFTMLACLPDILKNTEIQILWSSGQTDFEHVRQNSVDDRVVVLPFINDMNKAFAACDIVLCRAGAVTLAEICLWEKPSVLVPYPYAAADHQLKNALSMQKAGAARVIQEKDLNPEKLAATVKDLFSDSKLCQNMGKSAAKLAFPNAADNIIQSVLTLLNINRDGR
ncbi:undecaprenyldiphospho-muramoylpentapeptide beta-N-acetylglucosaminyltransferase [candidate division KSB1 bacterium]|nr:undecaprenyldiphospho-muramoylpentapeptide beta-N-acetylglucosaminyltransferase [candidate division KSB1 bacterium]